MTASVPLRGAPTAVQMGTGWWGCASAPSCSVGGSTRALVPMAVATGSRPCFRPIETVPKLRLLIADDQPLMRAGFRAVLEATGEMEVVGEAADGEQAVALARQLRPDVVLMDIRMPRLDGIEATRRLAGHRVLILTTFGLDEYIIEALRAGASGFILKDVPTAELVSAVRV